MHFFEYFSFTQEEAFPSLQTLLQYNCKDCTKFQVNLLSANSILKELFKKFWIWILLFLDIFYCNTLFPPVNVLKHSLCSSSHFFLFFFFFKFTLPVPLTVNIQCSLNGERRSSWACRLLVLLALTFFHPAIMWLLQWVNYAVL